MKKTLYQLFLVVVLVILLAAVLAVSGRAIRWSGQDSSISVEVVERDDNSDADNKPGDLVLSDPGVDVNVLKYFGNEVSLDLNGDGIVDRAYVATIDPGGSGTFYYLVGELGLDGSKVIFDAVLLGDRIAPQNTMKGDVLPDGRQIVIVNYADRKEGESFVTPPSQGKTLRLLYDKTSGKFGVVANDFEGEADPTKMKLTMKRWNWIRTENADKTIVTPRLPERFGLEFKEDKTVAIFTDCNNAGGEYSVSGSKLGFYNLISTMMWCEGSQESEYLKMINDVDHYSFTSKGELILSLKDERKMIFR